MFSIYNLVTIYSPVNLISIYRLDGINITPLSTVALNICSSSSTLGLNALVLVLVLVLWF